MLFPFSLRNPLFSNNLQICCFLQHCVYSFFLLIFCSLKFCDIQILCSSTFPQVPLLFFFPKLKNEWKYNSTPIRCVITAGYRVKFSSNFTCFILCSSTLLQLLLSFSCRHFFKHFCFFMFYISSSDIILLCSPTFLQLPPAVSFERPTYNACL